MAQQGFDYTQKTQQLAESRRVAIEQHQQNQKHAQFQEKFFNEIAEARAIENQINQYKTVNWQQLATDDPMKYLSLNQTFQDIKESYRTKVNEINKLHGQAEQTQAQNKSDLLQREAQAMMQAIPSWKDPAKSSVEMSELKEYLAKDGFTQQEISNLYDHRHVAMARKAMLYDKLIATGQKKVQAVLPTAKPGVRQQNPNSAQDTEMRQRLKKTGSPEYAAKLIERML